MTKRRRPQHLYNIEPAPQPAPAPSWLASVGGMPLTFVVSAVVGLAVWYGTTNSEQKRAGDDIAKLNMKLEEVSKATVTTTKEQDDRRAAMAREFLASNKEISTKVGELATTIAVQQATQQATAASLAKISDQLQQLNHSPRR